MSGLFAVNKPSGISSAGLLHDIQHVLSRSPLFTADLEAQAQRSANGNKGRKRARFSAKIKMGHGGTLDPLASGVLIVGVGRGTKQLGGFLSCSKEYEAVALFGVSTDTYDSEGKVVSRAPWKHITPALLERTIAAQFRGDIMQTPPIYSALKMQGKPLYEYAREGKPLPADIKARPAKVTRFDVTQVTTEHAWEQPKEEAAEEIRLAAQALKSLTKDASQSTKPTAEDSTRQPIDEQESAQPDEKLVAVHLSMTVSSGTYVRSLIHDLGIAVGSAAHMVALVRSRVGDYSLADALPPSAFKDGSWETTLSKTLAFERSATAKEEEEAQQGPPASDKAIKESQRDIEVLETLASIDRQAVEFLQNDVDKMGVTLTYAQSLDGCIGTRTDKPLTLSCPESFRVTHTLRRYHDYILVGAGTCTADDPGLNARNGHNNAVALTSQPVPVFVDLQGHCPLTKDAKVCKLARKGQGMPALRLVHRALFEARQRQMNKDADMVAAYKALEAGGVKTIFLDHAHINISGTGHASCSWRDIIACLRALDEIKQSIMIEGGASVIRSVLAERAASLVVVTVAPTFIGASGISLDLPEAISLAGVRTAVFGRDSVMSGTLRSV